MIHVTMRAMALVTGRDPSLEPEAMRACDAQHGDPESMVGVEAINCGSASVPDCPRCAVMFDAALETYGAVRASASRP